MASSFQNRPPRPAPGLALLWLRTRSRWRRRSSRGWILRSLRYAHAILNRLPVLVLVAVQSDPIRRSASVDPAIQCLVALAHLLPLVTPVALHNLRDQLLGGDLLEVLLAVAREVAVAGRERLPLLEVFVSRSFKAQPDLHAPLDVCTKGSNFNRRGLPRSAAERESPLITTTRWPCFRAHV